MRIRIPGQKPRTLEPGGCLKIGRNGDNDVVLGGGAVSRFHAEVHWDPDEDRPYVEDKGSANGVELDGALIDGRAYILGNDTNLGIGDHLLLFSLTGSDAVGVRAALLESDAVSGDSNAAMVRLFSDKGSNVEGEFASPNQLQRAMSLLERDKRTGTLVVTTDDHAYTFTFSQGRILRGETSEGDEGRDALDFLLTEVRGHFRFTREVEPAEANLDVAPSEVFDFAAEDTTRVRGLQN